MRSRNRTLEQRLLAAGAILVLALSACGAPTPEVTPTASSVPTGCDNSAFIGDVTIPDGTIVTPGQNFEKTWKLQNTGSCTWSTSYRLVFVSGEAMGGNSPRLDAPVAPGVRADISVDLTAPDSAGTYTGTWRMRNAEGQPFGTFITVVIRVRGGPATVIPGPSPTGGPETVTISGNAGKPQVLIAYAGKTGNDPSGSTTSADDGSYSFTVPYGWSGTVTPSKGSWTFSPASVTYKNVTSDLGGQDFHAQ